MNKALTAALALGLMGMSSAAFAQTATSEITMTGTVNNTCNLPSISATSSDGALGGTVAAATYTFTAGNFGGAAAMHTPRSVTFTFANAMCNYSARLGLKSANGAMTSAGGSVVNFANAVTYTATANWGAATNSLAADNSAANLLGSANATAVGPTNQDLTVAVTTIAPVLPLLARTYTDVLTVQIGAQL